MQVIGLAGGALLATRPLRAQLPNGVGTLRGTVHATQTNVPLPYAVVLLPQLSIERFTDASGQFQLASLPSGRYDVTVRRLGYAPFRGEIDIGSGTTTTLEVQLVQIPYRLTTQLVTPIERCERPGPPNAQTEPDVYQLVSFLRENADRYRLLASQYPFAHIRLRALGALRNAAFTVQEVDSAQGRSQTRSGYRPGRVVQRSTEISLDARSKGRASREYTMMLPTILDLADDAFARNHCFSFGGSTLDLSSNTTETWLRLDVRAADRLRDPDVHGAFYLDSATAQLRWMDLELSKPDRLPRALKGIERVKVSTSFVEIASGLSVIESICAVTHWKEEHGQARLAGPTELQRLLAYVFVTPPPDVSLSREFASPNWRAGERLPRAAVWCEQ